MSETLTFIGFVIAAGVSGTARWYLTRLSKRPEVTILVINLVGSFCLGLTFNASTTVRLIVGTALLGAFTTFSTFVQDLLFASTGQNRALLLGATILGCILAAWVGIQLAPNP